jgi:DNA-binding NarL/FixJ family response regulator
MSQLELTKRQVEAVRLASIGLEIKEAARETGLGIETIKTHRKDAMNRLGAKNMPEAVAIAIRTGVIQ